MAAYTTIDDPEAYFQVHEYTGNGSANHAITLGADTDLQPDLVWIKNRDAADANCLFDAVRGATKVLHSNTTAAEATDADTLDSFATDGFQVDADDKVNTNTEDYVAWNWKAGTTSGISGSPSITPSGYSFNATSGFSIIAYTGTGSAATLPHGLGVAPHFIIVKNRSGSDNWTVFHSGTGNTHFSILNSTSAAIDDNTKWNDTSPTSTLFTIGSDNNVNRSSDTYVAYAFAPVKGFSAIGSYTGNGNVDGTFVYTGFRPSYVMIKRTSGESWTIIDYKRLGYNGANRQLFANQTSIDTTEIRANILSNGFKSVTTNGEWNADGATYIYMAFAHSPFVNSNGVPCNAR